MSTAGRDRWAEWILNRRFGDDPEERNAHLAILARVRDRVLENARIQQGDVLLDVGAGDGLISFGALQRVGPGGKVILSDISKDLLDVSRSLARDMGVEDRCEFVLAPAESLTGISDGSVDVVTTRSVLIYVEDKRLAMREFRRVLKPGGRFSIFEPINSYFPSSPNLFLNYDVTPIADLAQKVRAVYERAQPRGTDPMMNFDERDLLKFIQEAGFDEIQLDLHVEIVSGAWWGSWGALLKASGNPLIPTVEEAMAQSLTPDESAEFEAYLRPLVEAKRGVRREAVVYLWGRKPA
ncbi:MAG: methyltransferase domain-containing protein [Actinomycetota bacterium]